MKTSNDEMTTARELGRNYAKLMQKLADGDLEKVVITKHGKMEGVLVTADRYEELVG